LVPTQYYPLRRAQTVPRGESETANFESWSHTSKDTRSERPESGTRGHRVRLLRVARVRAAQTPSTGPCRSPGASARGRICDIGCRAHSPIWCTSYFRKHAELAAHDRLMGHDWMPKPLPCGACPSTGPCRSPGASARGRICDIGCRAHSPIWCLCGSENT
jgi:hypothetical protein